MEKMYKQGYRLILGESLVGDIQLPKGKRQTKPSTPAKTIIDPRKVVKTLKAAAGSKELISKIPNLSKAAFWVPTATFSICQKTGTAKYLDLWDLDHFDGVTDMQRNLSECKVWFSDKGYSSWGSSETSTGRINCYFRAPTAGVYVCYVQLQSYGGSAQVECLIDSFSYNNLPVNGTINHPHIATLSAGYHNFRIRQNFGSFFFVGLTVWKIS